MASEGAEAILLGKERKGVSNCKTRGRLVLFPNGVNYSGKFAGFVYIDDS